MACLEQHQVAFVSVTQQFNTATSMGRLILNVLLSFAQFEREIIAERTRDKIAAARRKGKWVGGMPLLGYDVDPRGGTLRVHEREAVRVRAIFALYLQHHALRPVVHELARRGWRSKRWLTRKGRRRGGRPFTAGSLRRLLRNVTYRGQIRHRDRIHAGEHAAIVDAALWQQVQELLQHDRHPSPARASQQALLQGLVHCVACGGAMIGSQTTKGSRRYRYYVCSAARHHGWHTCPAPSVAAGRIEHLVVQQLRTLGPDPALPVQEFASTWEGMNLSDQVRLLRQLVQQVDYDGPHGKVSITFLPGGAAALAAAWNEPKDNHP